nr:class I SAM-dependent methyltransferase [Syntrophotalea carbinolica]
MGRLMGDERSEHMPIHAEQDHCPLCRSRHTILYFEDRNRRYRQCLDCLLVFVPRCFWLSRSEEKATYDLHQNEPHDEGYRHFLSRLSNPLLAQLPPQQRGLDFGCGPGPTLSSMLEEHGHRIDLYDPFYFNDPSVFDKKYDFICATEVVEHLHDPDREFTSLFEMLKRGGWLAIMTKLVIDRQAFSRWHYIRDLTHICFYSRETFAYLARRFNAQHTFAADDVILLQKH